MSYLEGDEAFDKVLDRLVDAERRASIAEDRLRSDDSDGKIANLQRELNNARSTITTLETDRGEALPKLAELWEAAYEARAGMGIGAIADIKDMSRLVKALDEARDHCDQVAF